MPVLSESGRFQTSIIIGSGIGVGINHAQVTGILPQLYSSGKIGMEISLLKYVRFRLEMSTFTYSHSAMSATGLLYRSREGFGIQGQAGFMPAFPPRRTGGGFLLGYGLTTSRDSGTHLVSAHPTASVTAFMAWKRNDMLETRVLLPLEYSFRNEAPVFSASVACEIAIPVSGSTSHQRQTDGKVHNGN